MSEKNTVDRAIEIEVRMAVVSTKIEWLEEEMSNWEYGGWTWTQLADRLEEFESELSDLQKEYRG
jgi:hypothetical protein